MVSGGRILVVVAAGAEGVRAVDLACRLGAERHAEIHVGLLAEAGMGTRERLEPAARQARLHHARVVILESALHGGGAVVRLARRLRPQVVVLAAPPRRPWLRLARWALSAWIVLRRAPCEVVVSRE